MSIKPLLVKEDNKSLALKRLREEFRQWYGNLSVRELALNKALVEEIKKVELLFSRLNLTGNVEV